MENITYLMGAGASFQCLPIYKNFRERFELFQQALSKGSTAYLDLKERVLLNELMNECQTLNNEFSFHNTPDTIAKKYFHLKENGLQRLATLKNVLTLFFLYEQCVSTKYIEDSNLLDQNKLQVDKRYDAFIATILETKYANLKINPRVNILTWNYDSQFELCYQNYLQKDFISTQLELQSIPSIETVKDEFCFDNSKFGIVHLNGIAFSQMDEQNNNRTSFGTFHTAKDTLVRDLLGHYKIMKSNNPSGGEALLNFAWERDESFPQKKEVLNLTFKCAQMIAAKTTVLVIIGYSFPIFNRIVDAALFSQMKNLKRIYIQSPDAEVIKSLLLDVFSHSIDKFHESDVKCVMGLEQFYIPIEMDRPIKEVDLTSIAW